MLDFDIQRYYRVPYAVPIYGYLTPVIICTTAVSNILILIILSRKHMRSPTNTILSGIAISDMLTGLFPLPLVIYTYGLGNYKDHMPYEWCLSFYYLNLPFYRIFHTASIWQTVALTVQRYLYINYSAQARKWLSIPNIKWIIVAIFVMAVLSHVMVLFYLDIHPTELDSMLHENTTVVGCNFTYVHWFEENKKIYLNFYYWFRVLFIHVTPCVLLVVVNSILFSTLRTVHHRRKRLLGKSVIDATRSRPDYSNRVTLILVIVVGLFVMVEIPVAIDFIIFLVQYTWEVQIYYGEDGAILPVITTFSVIVVCQSNFLIYCGMCNQFRKTLKSLFTGKPTATRHLRNQPI